MRCLSCKYDLRDIATGTVHHCPECGRFFNPTNTTTFLTERAWRRHLRYFRIGLIITLLEIAVVVSFGLFIVHWGFLFLASPLLFQAAWIAVMYREHTRHD
jgi:hypothetical protein